MSNNNEQAPVGLRAIIEEDFNLMDAVGGPRGVVESVVPTLVFLVLYTITNELNMPLAISVGSSLVLIAIRAIQRIPVLPALGGLFAIALSAFIAWRSGQAANFFVWGLVTNAAYLAGLLISLALRWPALGLLIGFLRGDATGWRRGTSPEAIITRRRYTQITWMWVALFAARLTAQLPLYLANATEALGVARLFMGVPLFALIAWFTWMMVRSLPPADFAADLQSHQHPDQPEDPQ
ncbi:DUF3159 domain-containing protein [Trueperella bialowiezensis]|uniref:Protein of uncharacterized function (DUF3159) n=1 Tax=Trueperella bialowiezensis TaxID=312285 RepID=A0A3S4VS31_9ACTO|nr:DUF3159 domain-containing protein [Trueperella bialowiezensis]VEI12507.1 Protein of uncharacterised function (DUF3159) [Trueperella bialowiezensis]